jgi:hypothetical protein
MEKKAMLLAFLAQEFPELTKTECLELCHKILDSLYTYDPGLGMNRPGGAS